MRVLSWSHEPGVHQVWSLSLTLTARRRITDSRPLSSADTLPAGCFYSLLIASRLLCIYKIDLSRKLKTVGVLFNVRCISFLLAFLICFYFMLHLCLTVRVFHLHFMYFHVYDWSSPFLSSQFFLWSYRFPLIFHFLWCSQTKAGIFITLLWSSIK